MKVLIVRLSAMGDIVHTAPVAVALRRARPDARIDWLVDRRYRAALDLIPVADTIVAIDPSGPWRSTVGAVRGLRAEGYDVVLDAQGLLKSAVVARLAGGARTIGFARPWLREPAAGRFYTESVDATGAVHVARRNLCLLRALGIDDDRIEMPAPVTASTVAEELTARVGPRFGLLSAGAGWPNKQWPPDRLGRVAQAIFARHGLPWVAAWGPGERPLAERVADAASGAVVVAPETTVGDLMALARRAAVVLAGDTGPIHLAAAAGTPVVGIYGPTDPARNGPWSPSDITISRFGECRCHYQRRCTSGAWCLDSVTVDEVVAAVERRLGLTTGRA